MRRHRWPAQPPPATGGTQVHGPTVLAAHQGLTLQLNDITAYPSGMQLRLVLTATGRCAELAHHETRTLTDPEDYSGHWSYLSVFVTVGDIEGEADPYHPVTRSTRGRPPTEYRTLPHYWVGTCQDSGALTLTAGWEEIGLPPTTTTIKLGPNPYLPSTSRSE
ncbi:hypothetical protein CBI38_27780 [Rhodococcus oxybenzonivorans]|uniref:Uncharacterized protein n=1 Tax=Rhodococcus oxybenzonivorans TaxID=1990687 RepID=A0A2S2C1P6_9NOCA|nr:hypothetical protein [Rhodococcus oxybenzonivorans]AWK74792.1 hypothetical protein CBI38_27780 [Rhodococcus oxybenzonivorans]